MWSRILIIGACLLSSAVMAQEKEYTLTVTATEVGMIGEGLQELPYKRSAPLMQKLQIQVNTQNLVTTAPVEVKPEEKK